MNKIRLIKTNLNLSFILEFNLLDYWKLITTKVRILEMFLSEDTMLVFVLILLLKTKSCVHRMEK